MRLEMLKVTYPVPDVTAADVDEASKFPVEIERLLPTGFPFGAKVTVIEVVKTWNPTTLACNTPTVIVDNVAVNPLLVPPIPKAKTLK